MYVIKNDIFFYKNIYGGLLLHIRTIVSCQEWSGNYVEMDPDEAFIKFSKVLDASLDEAFRKVPTKRNSKRSCKTSLDYTLGNRGKESNLCNEFVKIRNLEILKADRM